MTEYYVDQDEQGVNGFNKQVEYKAGMVLDRAIPQLRTGGDVGYGTKSGSFLVIHLGLGESLPVKLPVAALLKCNSTEDVKQLIETQYAIEKMT